MENLKESLRNLKGYKKHGTYSDAYTGERLCADACIALLEHLIGCTDLADFPKEEAAGKAPERPTELHVMQLAALS